MNLSKLATILLCFSFQLGCFAGDDGERTARANEKVAPYSLPVDDSGGSASDSNIDIRNISQIRDVELTKNGLLVLSNYSAAGSFALFQQQHYEGWKKVAHERFSSNSDRSGIFCMNFVDGQNGWAVGYKFEVWQTRDGGETWLHVGTIPDNPLASTCEALKFTSLQYGWMADLNGLYRTMDGGESWSRVPGISEDAGNLIFLDQSTGWVSAVDENNNSTLYVTVNGGNSWSSNSVDKQSIDDIYPQTDLQGMVRTGAGRVFQTSDAGRHLEEVRGLPVKFLAQSIFCLDSQICFISGYIYQDETASAPHQGSAVLFKTVDNGKTWSKIDITTEESFFAKVKFFNRDVGVLAGQNILYKTGDGGKSWSAILTFPTQRQPKMIK